MSESLKCVCVRVYLTASVCGCVRVCLCVGVCVVIAIIVCNWLHLWPRGANINKPIKDQVQRPNHSNNNNNNNKGNMCQSSTKGVGGREGGTWSTSTATSASGHTKWQAMKIRANGANCFMNLLLALLSFCQASMCPSSPSHSALSSHTPLQQPLWYVCRQAVGGGGSAEGSLAETVETAQNKKNLLTD